MWYESGYRMQAVTMITWLDDGKQQWRPQAVINKYSNSTVSFSGFIVESLAACIDPDHMSRLSSSAHWFAYHLAASLCSPRQHMQSSTTVILISISRLSMRLNITNTLRWWKDFTSMLLDQWMFARGESLVYIYCCHLKSQLRISFLTSIIGWLQQQNTWSVIATRDSVVWCSFD